MKTPSFVLLLVFGLAISTAHAQVSQEWVARYASATPWNDIPYAMTVDAGGYVYVTGTAATPGSNDWVTIKYNSAGTQEWLRTNRKSTRLNSSHLGISYAVFCLKKKKHT